MDERAKKIQDLESQIDLLSKQQAEYTLKLAQLQQEVQKLKSPANEKLDTKEQHKPVEEKKLIQPRKVIQPKKAAPIFHLEKFIGENLMNKVGILILLIGAFIGAKYAIENQLLSPVFRIISGYILSLILLTFALKLRVKYQTYSAVLLSGALSMAYFISYSAFNHYHLISKAPAFGIMVLITVLTVYAANLYKQQIIALIGMVGAYAIPFLLSDGSGQVAILLSYILIINLGLLIVSIRNYWKTVLYAAILITWTIVLFWYLESYSSDEHYQLAMLFTALFFLSFYALILLFKSKHHHLFAKRDISLLLINSFTAFGLGYAFLNDQSYELNYLGFYTLCHALVHLLVYLFFYYRLKINESFALLILGLSLSYGTLAIPIQLDGNWVNSIWIFEAAVLFWIGRSKKIWFYERFSYPLAILAFFALISSYNNYYLSYSGQTIYNYHTALLNMQFLSSLLYIAALSAMVYWNLKIPLTEPGQTKWSFKKWTSWFFPSMLILVSYLAIRYEINHFWYQKYQWIKDLNFENEQASLLILEPQTIFYLRKISQIAYGIGFFVILSVINYRFFKLKNLTIACSLLLNLFLLGFLVEGINSLHQILAFQLNLLPEFIWPYWIRYSIYPLIIAAWYIISKNKSKLGLKQFTMGQEIYFHLFLITLLSAELIHWLEIVSGNTQNYWSLSLLWGLYSLGLIFWGIKKKKSYLRVSAIVLFSVTLIKLFFYDLSDLNNLSKTLVLISLGVLLLLISFLYHKFKPTDQS